MKKWKFQVKSRSSKKEQLSVSLGKFLGASNNGEDNVYNLATVLERGDLKRCALCSTYTKRECTRVYILSFELCKYLDTKSTHTFTEK